ncbi:hypothetical protein QFC22_005013 [Naganishia vaughanmartiniae]|uniref:Uncharacterized protein n=1 Tax=Naganishia vaughanmartiniae TaxID=1424756 RepID=A0ACC2WYI2_9TREE|nr:hypothetical protein QFC22_005013 [Naganishia vaughanmartiniae]
MSTPPVFKQRKPRLTSTRARDEQPSTQDGQPGEEEEEEMGVSPMAAALKRKKENTSSRRRRTEAGKGKLSFGDADEEETTPQPAFIPRKSTLSQSVSSLPKQTTIRAFSSSNTPTIVPDATAPPLPPPASTSKSTYNQSYLAQLKASTPTRYTLQREPGAVIAYDEDGDAAMPGEETAGEDTTAGIPDEAVIKSAIARRRRHALEGGTTQNHTTGSVGDDYISLTATTSRLAVYDHSSTQGPHPESRLQRESDSEGEGDEQFAAFTGADERLGLRAGAGAGGGGNQEHARRMRREMRDALEDADMDVDGVAAIGRDGEARDEDEERWEDEQVRRAGAGMLPGERKPREPTKQGYTSAKIPTPRPLPTITLASSRLSTSLQYLVAERTQLASQTAATKREKERLDVHEQAVREEVERVEGKREWMMQFVGWVEMLGGFLEEKVRLISASREGKDQSCCVPCLLTQKLWMSTQVPLLDKIEADELQHYRERKGMIATRRQGDDEDDVALFLGVASDGSATGNGAEEVQEVDEMGRTIGGYAKGPVGPYAGVRKGRREARFARKEARRLRSGRGSTIPAEDDDGYSTDSSLSPADAEDYETALASLLSRAEDLDKDIKAEEFRDPAHPSGGVAYWFSQWRRREPEEYAQAFGGLGCVQAWEYWARKEMVGWEPSRSNVSVDSFRWFHALHAYSHPKPPVAQVTDTHMSDSDPDDEEEPPLAPEGDMAGAMVAGAVIRLVINAVQAGEYDPYSLAQTRKLVDLVDLVSDYTGKGPGKYKVLLGAILAVFQDQIQALSTLISATLQPSAIAPPAFDPASRTALSTFTNRRLKLLKNMLAWRRYAPQDTAQLVGMLLHQVVQPCLSRCWDSGGKELTAKVLQVVPETMMSGDMLAFFKPISRP